MLARSVGNRIFTGLSDVPSSYSGQANLRLRVNAAATAIEFFESPYRVASDYSIVGDGVTDNATALNNAITSLNLSGGGTIYFLSGGTYLVNSLITLKNYVHLVLAPNAVIKWGGAASGTIFQNSTTQPLVDASVRGGNINGTNAGIYFDLHSCQLCIFGDHYMQGTDNTSIVYKLTADVTSSTGSPLGTDGSQNFAFNIFRNIYHVATAGGTTGCGTLFRLDGDGTRVLTLNTFHNIAGHHCWSKGFDFVKWVDNNFFTGSARVGMYGNNSIGVDMNSGSPSSNVGVYTNCFYDLAVDTFGTYTGRKGIQLGWSKGTKIDNYFQDPAAEGGSFVDNASQSHYIVYHQSGGAIELKSKNLIGFGGSSLTVRDIDGSPSYSSITALEFNNGSVTNPSAGVARVNISVGDIDGGLITDTYVNTANIDGGAI